MYVASRAENHVEVEISFVDTGIGMNAKKLDALFRELEQVQSESNDMLSEPVITEKALPEPAKPAEGRTLGLGLAVVARIIRNMNGQLRLKSEEGKGSRFVIAFPFEIPEGENKQQALEAGGSQGSVTPHAEQSPESAAPATEGMLTLVERSSNAPSITGSTRSPPGMLRKDSADSVGSKHSLGSLGSYRSGRSNMSKGSNRSGKSEAERSAYLAAMI